MNTAMYDYNGYKLTVRTTNGLAGSVAVFDPRFKRQPPLYKTTSLDLAMKWVDAYRDGQHWAMARANRNA